MDTPPNYIVVNDEYMKKKYQDIREKIRDEVKGQPDVWFTVSYKIKYNSIDREFDFKNIKQSQSTRDSDK